MPKGKHAYRVAACWTSGHTGIAKSDSALNAIHFTAPKNLGGLEGRWTAEELLLAAVASCFTTTLRSLAGSAGFKFTDFQVEACGTAHKAAGGYFFREIVLRPTLEIADFNGRDHALELLRKAERLCLVARTLDLRLSSSLRQQSLQPGVRTRCNSGLKQP